MNVIEFQERAHSFADYLGAEEGDFRYPALGLAEEAGEVAGKFAKAVRDDNGIITEERREAIKKELGDVLWFVAELATLLEYDLEDIMEANIEKLTSRKARNKIHGSGDDR